MGEPEYDEAMKSISALQKARAEAHWEVRFIDMVPSSCRKSGGYTDMARMITARW